MRIYRSLMHRARMENRVKGCGVYFERHHIIPDFMFVNRRRKGPKGHLPGDPNDPNNIVLLTCREHILAHVLLAKALRGQQYGVQAASAVMFFYTKAMGHQREQVGGLAGISYKFERYRMMGVQAISQARKGTFPAKCAVTGVSVGSVSNQHPKVLSGEWVHATKGRVQPDEEKQNRPSGKGELNNNYKEMTYERKQRLYALVRGAVGTDGYIKQKTLLQMMREEFVEFKKLSVVWIRNNFGSFEKFVEQYNIDMNDDVKFERYHRYTTVEKDQR